MREGSAGGDVRIPAGAQRAGRIRGRAPCPRPTPRRRTPAGPTPTWPTTLRRSRPTRWAACRSSRRTTVACRSTSLAPPASRAPVDVATRPCQAVRGAAPGVRGAARPTTWRRRRLRPQAPSHAERRRPTCPSRSCPRRRRVERRADAAPARPGGVRARRRARPRARRRCIAESEAEESAYARGSTEAEGDENDINLNDLLMHVLDTGASDLHLTSGARPSIRLNGELKPLEDQPDPDPAGHPAGAVRRPHPEAAGEVRGEPRARLRLQRARAGPGSASTSTASATRSARPSASSRSRSRSSRTSASRRRSRTSPMLPRGFVLVTGPTGSGKSTTLAVAHRPGQPHRAASTS